MKRTELKNNVVIIGELKNKEVTRRNVGTPDETISMELTVSIDGIEEHKASFFAYKYGKGQDGNRVMDNSKISKLWEGYNTVDLEYKFMAQENGDGTGERVKITGELSKNKYVDKSNELKKIDRVKGVFCSRIKEDSGDDNLAQWQVHGHILSIREDVEDKTGNYILVKVMVVGYSEEEFDIRIYNDKVKKGFMDLYNVGDSTVLLGKLVNRPDSVVEVVEDDMDDIWGDTGNIGDTFNTTTITRKYLELVRGDRVIDTSDEEHPLSEEKMVEYRRNIREREEQIMNKHKEKMAREGQVQKNIDPNVGVDLNEIPF